MSAPSSGDRFEPKLITVFREGYGWRLFAHDVGAGAIVGIVALPLAIAFGIASGVKPEQGLYTAVVAGFLISVFGGSRVQIGGPTGAFIVIVYGIVQRYGYDGLAVATMMAGLLLVLMGAARLGAVIKFIPYPVTVGFTAGIALIIATGQFRDLLGLQMPDPPSGFFEKLSAYGANVGTVRPAALAVGLGTVVLMWLWPRVSTKVPGPLVALVIMTLVVALGHLPVETIGDRFGAVPTSLPRPSLPHVDWATARELLPSAVSIALLAGIESLLSAVVADGMAGTRHRSNTELIAQGIANLATPLFGGIPATGAIARTATNVRNGGRTPVAGIVHAGVLLLIIVAFARWAEHIPMAALAGILLVVAYNMSEWRVFLRLFRSPRSDVLVLLTTFGLTVAVDLVVALQVGMVLAAFLFMRRMAALTDVGYLRDMLHEEEETAADRNPAARRDIPPGVEVFDLHGPLFFGAASAFKDAIHQIARPPRVLILRLREVPAIDATGLRALEDLVDKAAADGTAVVLSGMQRQPSAAIERSGITAKVGRDNVQDTFAAALERARALAAAGD